MKHNVATILSETREILYNFLSQTSHHTTTRQLPFLSINRGCSLHIHFYLFNSYI